MTFQRGRLGRFAGAAAIVLCFGGGCDRSVGETSDKQVVETRERPRGAESRIVGEFFLKFERGTDALTGMYVYVFDESFKEQQRELRDRHQGLKDAIARQAEELTLALDRIQTKDDARNRLEELRLEAEQAALVPPDKKRRVDYFAQGISYLESSRADFLRVGYSQHFLTHPVTRESFRIDIRRRDESLRLIDAALAETQQALEPWKQEYDDAVRVETAARESYNATLQAFQAGGTYEDLAEQFKKDFIALYEMQQQLLREEEQIRVVQETTPSVLKFQPDMDGKFSVDLKPGRYTLAVYFNTEVTPDADEETYLVCWLLDFEVAAGEVINDMRLTQANATIFRRERDIRAIKSGRYSPPDIRTGMNEFLVADTISLFLEQQGNVRRRIDEMEEQGRRYNVAFMEFVASVLYGYKN